jgi:MFS family permease
VIAAQAFVSIAVNAQSVILAIYLSKAGYSEIDIGLILTVSPIVTTLMLLPGGMIADAVGRKKISALGLALGAVSLAGYIYPVNLYYLFVISGIGGLGSALYGGSVTALLADSAPTPEKRNLVFSIAASITTLTGIIGFLAGGVPNILRTYGFGETASYYPIFILSSGSLAIASILMLMLKVGEHNPGGGSRALLKLPTKSYNVILKSTLYVGMLFMGAGLLAPSLLSLWLYKRFSVEEGLISIPYAISQAILGISFLASPAIAKRFGTIGTVVLTQSIAAAMLASIPLIPSFLAVSVIYMAMRILINIPSPIIRSFILGLVDPSERASASSILALTTGLSGAAMPAVTGFLMSKVSLESPFYLASSIILASVLTFYVLFKQYESEVR